MLIEIQKNLFGENSQTGIVRLTRASITDAGIQKAAGIAIWRGTMGGSVACKMLWSNETPVPVALEIMIITNPDEDSDCIFADLETELTAIIEEHPITDEERLP